MLRHISAWLLLAFLSLGQGWTGMAVDWSPLGIKDAHASYKTYRAIRKSISKRYYKAKKRWYREPCVSFFRMKAYERWLDKREARIPQEDISKRYKRILSRRIRSYRRYAKRRKKRIFRSCRKYWKKVLKRRAGTLKPACRGLEDANGVELWIGVRPWAHVYLNGKLCGTAPLKAKLRAGSYTVRLVYSPSNDNYEETVELSKKPVLITRWMNKAPKSAKGFENLLSPKQLRWVIRQNHKSLRSCGVYQSDIHKIKLSWQINVKGETQAVRWVSPIHAKSRFRRCILRAVGRWRFPKLKGTASFHDYPISLITPPSK